MKVVKSREGVYRIHLPFRFAVGFSSMTHPKSPVPYWCRDRYFAFREYFDRSWSVRVLWFHFGRMNEGIESWLRSRGEL